MKKILIIFAVLALIFSAVFIANRVIAENDNGNGNGVNNEEKQEEEEEEEECVPSVSCGSAYRCNEYSVYRCGNNDCGRHGGAMEEGTMWYECVDCDDGCGGSWTEVVGGPYGPDQIRPYGEVPEYRICPPQYNEWSTSPPVPECRGFCYPEPVLKSLDDPDLLPANVPEGSKYKLPMNFGWEDNVETEVAKPQNFCPVDSYELNIVEPSLSEIVPNTPYNQLATTSDQSYKLECRLKSNNAYQWRVRACLDAGGADCGDWSESQGFETSSAPEPKLPYDPDWAGEELAENVRPFLEWCPVEDASSYFFEIYREGREEVLLPERAVSSFYDDDIGWQEIKKGFSYWWQVAWCPEKDTPKDDCSPFSQFWGLISGEELLMATNLSPKDGAAVNLSTILNWLGARHAAAYWVNIQGDGLNENFRVLRVEEGKDRLPLKEIWEENLKSNTLYYWQVATCSKTECGDWSEIITFRTTGAAPTNVKLEPENEMGEVGFPLTISWDDMPGAASYTFEMSEIGLLETLAKSEKVLDFAPSFRQGNTYTVLIYTCAGEGVFFFCGLIPAEVRFTAANLKAPVITRPAAGTTEFIPSLRAEWEKVFGANAYEYQLLYTAAEPGETARCQARVGTSAEGTTPSISTVIPARCEGQYSLQIRGCIDKACKEELGKGQWSTVVLTVKEHPKAKVGLVPCGQPTNNPATDPHWDERDPCEIKHLFLLIKIIIDFLLFRVAPLVLVLLALYSGIIFYFSLGKAAALARVISLWKAAGIGLLLMFFSWTIVNFILGMAGFQIGIFGNWYEF